MATETKDSGAPRGRHGRLWSVLSVVAILASLYFVGAFVLRHWEEVRHVPTGLDPLAVGIYLAGTAAYFVYQGLLWKMMYASHGYPIATRRVLTMYVSAILLAYVPGKVGASLGVAAQARAALVPAPVSVYLFFRAQLLFLFAGVMAAVTASFFVPGDAWFPAPFRLGAALAIVAVLAATIASRTALQRGFAALIRLVRLEGTIVPVGRTVWLRDLGLLYASWFLYGGAFWWLVKGCGGDVAAPLPYAQVSLVLTMSYLGAYLAVFVPAGLGILEATLIVGLDRFLEAGAAVWVAIGHRILTVLLSVFLLLALLAVGKLSRRRAR
ncbi:lysylphosphatidylglycerol synthase domain-containing protein [bacterium]|nr:lysylphosphatidylglycerol synthase domain-containing protein [bacterium]